MEHSQADKEPYAEDCRGLFWRIWAAERRRRSTLERNHMGRSVLPDSGSPEGNTEHETHCQEDNEHNSGEGYPNPPHPTQPKPDPSSVRVFASEHERYYLTLQPKPDPSSVRVFASETERYYPTPPHPTKARPQLSACVCKRNWTLLPYPTPPHPTQPKPDPSSVRVFASETERYPP